MDYNHQKAVGKLYDMIFEEFDKTRLKPDEILKTLVERDFSNSKLLLDNGCGNCRNSRIFTNAVLIAGDISKNMLKKCRSRVASNIHHVRYTLTCLPFRDRVFNGIICIAAIHHLKEEEMGNALREMRRVLNPRGWMLVSTWSIKMLRNKKLLSKTEKIDEKYFLVKWKGLPRFYFLTDSKTLGEVFSNNGFRDKFVFEYGMNNYVLIDRRRIS